MSQASKDAADEFVSSSSNSILAARPDTAAEGREQLGSGCARCISKEEEPKAEQEPPAQHALDFGQVSAYLSNERTFLAWACTGMLLMGFGVAIAKMRIAIYDFSQTTGAATQSTGAHEISPVTMGLSFLVVGLVTILLSAIRYLTVQNQLRKHTYEPSNILFFIFLTALAVLSGTLIIHVWQLRQTAG